MADAAVRLDPIRRTPAPDVPSLEGVEVHLWHASFDAADAERYAALCSPDERRRAAAFRSEEDGTRFVIARGVLRSVLGRYGDTAPEALRFEYGARGKPFLPHENLPHFNLSHSGDLVLIAVSDRVVGVDVERVRPDLVDAGVEAVVLAPDERAGLRACSREERVAGFFTALTYKEAYAKALGIGMQLPLSQLSILPYLRTGPTVLLPETAVCSAGKRWRLEGLNVGEGYRAALALEGHDAAWCCRHWDG